MMFDLPVPSAGDHDLDLDVERLLLTDVARSGDGLVLRAVGTFPSGSRVDIDVEPYTALPSAVPVGRGAARLLDREFAVLMERLQQWCAAGTPLRLLAAPGKHLALVSPDGTVIPLPRRS